MNQIKKYRKAKGLTQTEIAKKVGLSQAHIGRMENGERNINLNHLKKIANALKVEPWQLLPSDMQPINAKEIFMAKNKLLLPFRYIGFGVRNALAFILRNCFDCMVVYPLIKKGNKNAK